MKPGSVVVDLAAETGGNVEGSVPGEVVRIGNAQVWGGRNVPSQMPGPASRLYAQNIVNLVTLMTATGEGRRRHFAPDFDDEIVAGSCVTHDGDDPTTSRRARPWKERSMMRRGRRLADDLHPQRVRRHRGDLEGLLDPAHAADVGRQRHPRRHPARRDHRHRQHRQHVALVVGLVAIVLAAVNMVGGFVVTDRMLQMFVRKKPAEAAGRRRPASDASPSGRSWSTWPRAVCFILALKGLSGPKTARNGNLIGAVAAVVACALPVLLRRPRPRPADPRGRSRSARPAASTAPAPCR